jgi:dTDP-4-amino-4,6-dideoxygalactose transaminase
VKVPFLDLKAAYLELKDEIDSAIARVLNSGQYILGDEVDAFEAEWASYCEAKYAVGLANGLDALHLALLALGVGPGDEVVVPSNTYIATWLAVSQCGARPVPVEPLDSTYNMDPERIEAAITPRTKVILPVHLYGQPADIDPILEVAHKYGLRVIEDAAQSHGASYKGRRIGAHSDVVAWSFYPGKNLGALGDGGAITTDDTNIASRIRILRNYGSQTKYLHQLQGYNSRLDPIQAAVLRTKLAVLDLWNERRKKIAGTYLKNIHFREAQSEVGSNKKTITLPTTSNIMDSVWHLFVIRCADRAALQKHLTEQEIASMIHYPTPPHLQAAYAALGYKVGSFPIAERMSREVISLPLGPHLEAHQVEMVISAIKSL